MCLPFELRFLGTCLEDLGKRDFHELRDTEVRANNSAELSDLQCISDKRTQRKLALFLSLLKSCNHACSNGLYKILANFDSAEINTIINNSSSDENPLEELLLLYTLALNHPAFSYEQKAVFGNILVKLQEEENKIYSAKHQVGISLLYVKPQIQPCAPCPSSEERQQQDVGILGHCPSITIPPSHSAGDVTKGRSSMPPGLGVPPGLGLPPEQLTATSYVHVAFSSPGHQPLPSVPWHSGMSPLVMTGLCGTIPTEVQGAGEASPYPSSPLMSRQSSPSQSGSPSRAGSPTRLQQPPQPQTQSERTQSFSKGLVASRRNDRNGSHSSTALRQNCVDSSAAPPSTQHRNVSRKSSVETQDSFRETLVKEMPNYQSLQKYRLDEFHRMRDEELKELGLPNGAIIQLRSIVSKISNTNGLCNVDKRDAGRRKPDESEQALTERKTQSAGPVVRRYPNVPLESGPMMYPQPQGTPCFTCIAVPVSSAAPRYHGQAQPFYCMNHHLRTLHLDGSNSSSASDSSSTSHSPPDTPSMPSAPHWDSRGGWRHMVYESSQASRVRAGTDSCPSVAAYVGKEAGTGERWSPGCDDKERRQPDTAEEGGGGLQQPPTQNSANSRPRLPAGLGRSKANPPGLQTLPRGRGPGPNPSTVILEGNHKTLPSCRREGPSVNGAQVAPPPTRTSHPPPPPPPHEDRKMFLVPSELVQHGSVTYTTVNSSSQPPPQAPQYSGSNSGGGAPPRPGDSNVPYTAYLPHAHFPALRTTGSIFPSFPPGSYIRPTYPFPNGELVYQYHGPQTPPPPPPAQFIPTPVVTYSTVVPPPKVSCYNCGSQSHHATDCKESTMEEMTKQGQYRLDYSPYQKAGECSSEK
ncbi:hypothetical protein ANN_18941 [Periplaneta americana]|uniref:CCHC-type domain-containing protein n=1 Tax=Periplaneta americana TaxID=6978 RepID=A0ABQ8SRG5_PERAM|nr:hypothetical protein ANN_18941 [Periplaneta americana]